MSKHATHTGSVRTVAAVVLAVGLLAGCDRADPYQREGLWRPSGANAANLAAMVANPADLAGGRGDTSPQVRLGTGAVELMWRGAAAGGQGGGGGQQLSASGGAGQRPPPPGGEAR